MNALHMLSWSNSTICSNMFCRRRPLAEGHGARSALVLLLRLLAAPTMNHAYLGQGGQQQQQQQSVPLQPLPPFDSDLFWSQNAASLPLGCVMNLDADTGAAAGSPATSGSMSKKGES